MVHKSEFKDSLNISFSEENIAVALASNNNYTPYLGVIINSIIKNSINNFNYDIFILETDITEKNKNKILSILKKNKNFKIYFINMKKVVSEYKFFVNRYFSVETYFRLFLPNMLKNHKKILYLDVDMIVLSDISELFNLEINDYLLAASRNLSTIEQAITNGYTFNYPFRDYCKNILRIENPEDYFQAGVLLLNLEKMREDNIQEKALEMVNSNFDYMMHDQDILNSLCNNKIKILSQNWNFYSAFYPKYTSKDIVEDFINAGKCPKIVHFAGDKDDKVWYNFRQKYALCWWLYAFQTPFRYKFIKDYIKYKLQIIFVSIKRLFFAINLCN